MSLEDVKRRILTRSSLAAVIGDTVKLETRSGRPVGLCPFHADKNPSFTLYDERYICFACKEKGDVIDFVKKTRGLSFVDTLRYLAERFGVEAPELDESRSRLDRHKREASLYGLMREAQELFASQLKTPRGSEAMQYLRERGFSEDSITSYGFGITPTESFGLVKHLRQKGFHEEDMVTVCLARSSTHERKRYHDFFRERIMLPIKDRDGRIIAFGGRTLDNHPAKYMNSSDTPLFSKSHTLFGFDKARATMRGRGRALVVEGYMDTLQLWQGGFVEAVACLGTAFTESQLKMLRNATSKVVLLFDGDGAGRSASFAAITTALAVPELEVRVAELPTGEDPDSFLRAHGEAALDDLIARSSDLLDFTIQHRLKTTHRLGIPDLLRREIGPWLAQIPDRLQRNMLMIRISQLTGIAAEHIEREALPESSAKVRPLQAARQGGPDTNHKSQPSQVPVKPLDPAHLDLFGHVFHGRPGELDHERLKSFAQSELEVEPSYLALMEEMIQCLEKGQGPAERQVLDWPSALAPEVSKLLDQLQAAEPAFACDDRRQRLEKVIIFIKSRQARATIQSLKKQMALLAAQPGQDVEVRRLLAAISELTRQAAP